MFNHQDEEYIITSDTTYYKGQTINFQGIEAMILDVKPVLTIKIKGKNQIICGNALLKDICPELKL